MGEEFGVLDIIDNAGEREKLVSSWRDMELALGYKSGLKYLKSLIKFFEATVSFPKIKKYTCLQIKFPLREHARKIQ